MASTTHRPTPFQAKTVSVMTAPASKAADLQPDDRHDRQPGVAHDVAESTRRSVRPFARAVRT